MSIAHTDPYDPKSTEDRWYQYWLDNNLFDTDENSDKEPHTIVMPPPNVTGRLHMGHALQGTVQDAITRIRRMQGFEALWLPGIDHAGIATQNVVEKTLKKTEKKNRHDVGREAFVEKVWEWKEEYGSIINDQYAKLGTSCDWKRGRFTMDEGFSKAVEKVFVDLYKDGLVYRGNYLVNWCPVDMTALSDEEVNNVERNGHLWEVRYPMADGEGSITVATTRPETILGDTAIAVHPEDERYTDLIGKEVRVPLTDRTVKIIADDYVDPEFGAGALKVTPGHDRNDFEMGQRHDLEVISIMNEDATLNELCGAYEGMDRFDAREKMVADLEEQGLLGEVIEYKGTVPISSRSKAIIEPLISTQWFVKMKPLAEPALEAVRNGTITFYPKRWENEYFRWLENIRDWPISRQLWWGHRIPVWYYTTAEGEIDEERDFVVSVEQPEDGMVQDEDVLDTWFSSWLWPFATLGWPEKTKALEFFHPTKVLVSGYDIIFFWIARMIMASLHFTGKPPYTDIFITGMIKDKQGRWMSKSLGNGIDPLDMIDQYGADAVRFSLTILCAQGQDIKLDPLKFEMGRNFANKIWNAFNVFGRSMSAGQSFARTRSFGELELVERWMVDRLNNGIVAINESLDRYRLNEAVSHIYDLFWRDYCDWYLELVKPGPDETMAEEKVALAVELYETLIQLLHPFMPYITEELWWKLRDREEGDACITSAWPTANAEETDESAGNAFETIKSMVSGIRNVKNVMSLPPSQKVGAVISIDANEPELMTSIQEHAHYIERLARVENLEVGIGMEKPANSSTIVVGHHQVFIPLEGLIDLEEEKKRLSGEIQQKEKFLMGIEKKLSNENFVARAPKEVVDGERAKADEAKLSLETLRANLADIGG